MMNKLTFESAIALRDGNTMPVIGYSSTEHSYNHVTQTEIFLDAIELGYRYFDLSYDDDCLIPLRRAIDCSGISREEFFIACRFGDTQNRNVPGAGTTNELLEQFGGTLDLVSLAWPYYYSASSAWSGPPDYSKSDNGYPISMQNLYQDVVREIGVCNFDVKHLEMLKEHKAFEMLPMVDQNQFHPLYTCEELRRYCRDKGIVFVKGFEKNDAVMVKKPLYETDVSMNGELFELSERERRANEMNLQRYNMSIAKVFTEEGSPLADDAWRSLRREVVEYNPYDHTCNPREEKDFYDHCVPIRRIGEKYGKTNRQIIDRWALQHGAVILVKGIWRKDMETGKDLFDFELTPDEMKRIDSFNMDKRFGYHPDYIDF